MTTPVLVLYNLPAVAADQTHPVWDEADRGVLNAVEAVARALEELGQSHRKCGIRRLCDIPDALAATPGAPVFNLVERLDDYASAFNHVPAVCEALAHPCTGNSSDALGLTLDKWITKARLAACGVPVPAGVVIAPGDTPDLSALPLPAIVKPLSADGSEGIDAASVAHDRDALLAAAARVHARCEQPALAEAFIAGREFNISMYERDGRVVPLPVSEIDFSLFPPGRPHIVDYDVKWKPGTIGGRVSPRRCPADVDASAAQRLRKAALDAWHACACRDYVRVDMRMNAQGDVFVLEVNANPDVSPLAGLPAALKAAGIPFAEFVREILANAQRRAGLPP